MIDLTKVKVPKDEVLRYLGYKKQVLSSDLDSLIDETIEESKSLIMPKFVYAEYKTIIHEDSVELEGTNLVLEGNDIREHLKNASSTVIMAVTLGTMIEKKISFYEKINLTKALILDSCATTIVEEICDLIEEEVKEDATEKGLGITFRYSPGYGDLPLKTQRDFINTLRADKSIGLTASEHYLLFPRKSVTAIIGLIPKNLETKKRTCEVCKNYNNCSFRKEGATCGS